jgi:hypothetical protein
MAAVRAAIRSCSGDTRCANSRCSRRQVGVCQRETGARCLNFALELRRFSAFYDGQSIPAPHRLTKIRVNDTTRPPIAADTTCVPCGSPRSSPATLNSTVGRAIWMPADAIWSGERYLALDGSICLLLVGGGRLIAGLAAATTTGEKKGQVSGIRSAVPSRKFHRINSPVLARER